MEIRAVNGNRSGSSSAARERRRSMLRAMPVGLFVVSSALLLGGCGGGSGLSNSGACALPNGVQTTLVYPAPGATGIPDNFGLVVLGSTAPLPPTYQDR